MNELLSILQQHHIDYPAMEPQDAVKLLYQHFCGPGHLISDPEQALARLEDELARTAPDADTPLYQPVGNSLFRLNLAACKAMGLEAEEALHAACEGAIARFAAQEEAGGAKTNAICQFLPQREN